MFGIVCETRMIVRRCSFSSAILFRHFAWNAASPTARTSSTRRISGSMCAATANPSRTTMPEE